MFGELFLQAWDALKRNPTRTLLTMTGIVWGIMAVTLLIAYGDGFRYAEVCTQRPFGYLDTFILLL